MLVLSRKQGESIVVNNGEVLISIVDIRGDKVRIGITAPPNVPVHRFEVQQAIDRSKDKDKGDAS